MSPVPAPADDTGAGTPNQIVVATLLRTTRDHSAPRRSLQGNGAGRLNRVCAMTENELEETLCKMLTALAAGAKSQSASRAAGMGRKFIFSAIKRSEAGDPLYSVSWLDESSRQFCELVPIARRMGHVKREQKLRGVTINGEQQYVLDPALLARFGDDADSAAMAELSGYEEFPFAHDVDGNRIPLLSARFPRPQRQRTPHPWKRNSPPPDAVSEQSSGADKVGKQNAAGSLPIRDWRPDDPEPPYSRRVRCAAPPPIVHVPSPASPRVATPPPRVVALLPRTVGPWR